MMKTIAIIHLKGGVGRSTVSTTLASVLSKQAKTTLVDADLPQATASSWWTIRSNAGQATDLELATVHSAPELLQEVGACANDGTKFCIIDTPPRLSEVARASMLLSDLVVVPVAPSPGEIWACSDVVDVLKEASTKNIKKVPAYLLWNRYRQNTKLTQEIVDEAVSLLGLPAFRTTLGLRVSYAEAMGQGKGADELSSDRKARDEVQRLAKEILEVLS